MKISMNCGIGDHERAEIGSLLSCYLADLHLIALKTRQFHWNVKGMHFAELHEFFGEIYESLDKEIDETAERIQMLGLDSPGSMKEFLALTRLKEHSSSDALLAPEMISGLFHDHEVVVRILRKEIARCSKYGDDGTADFLTGQLRSHEKTCWMLRAHMG